MELGEMATLTQTLSDEAVMALAAALDQKSSSSAPPRRSQRSPFTRTPRRISRTGRPW